jgi:myosin heavy subunit
MEEFEAKIKSMTIKLREKDLQYEKEKAIYEMQAENLKSQNATLTSTLSELKSTSEENSSLLQSQTSKTETLEKKYKGELINSAIRHAEDFVKLKEEGEKKVEKSQNEISNLQTYNEKLFAKVESLSEKYQ